MIPEDRKRVIHLAMRTAVMFVAVVAGGYGISQFYLSDFSEKLLEATLNDALIDTRELGDFIAERLAEGFISPNDRARIRTIMEKYGFIYIVAADADGGVVFNMGIPQALALGKIQDKGIQPLVLTGPGVRIPVYDIAVGMPGGRVLHAGIPQEGLTPELAEVTDRAGNLLRVLFALALGAIAVAIAYGGFMVRRVRRLRQEIERQSRLAYLGEIAGSLAHEIRNPLNTINMNIQLLDEKLGGEDEKTRLKLSRVRSEVMRLDSILTSFLRFARPPKLNLAKMDIVDALTRLAEFVGPEFESAGMRIRIDVKEEIPEIRGDAEQLRQLFLNLLLNARDACQSGDDIVVSISKTSRRVHVAIIDEGCGIEKKQMERIFEPYTTNKETGTGVGLAIVRRVAMDHGGSVRVESKPGVGTTFTVSLPR
ncbi:MAG TPA: GHKL domain-containing protein [candidate division Zixibacteria bacterium]|nr:GHKL domain-containing protein [candidate division Zixibacteria bacterium]